MGGGEAYFGGDAGVEGIFPAGGAEAPAIAGFEAFEVPLRARGDKVVAAREGKGEEVIGDLHADGVYAGVFRAGVATAIPVEAGKRSSTASLEDTSENIQRGHTYIRPHKGLFKEGRSYGTIKVKDHLCGEMPEWSKGAVC